MKIRVGVRRQMNQKAAMDMNQTTAVIHDGKKGGKEKKKNIYD
jgi:NaMN:DMB phosphoribosyltransferase